jgi:hypothetical protein
MTQLGLALTMLLAYPGPAINTAEALMFGAATSFSASAQTPCGSEILLALYNFGSDTPYHRFAVGCADLPPGTTPNVPSTPDNASTGIGSLHTTSSTQDLGPGLNHRRRSAREVPVSKAILGTAQSVVAAGARRRVLAASSVDVKTRQSLRSLLWGYNQKHAGAGGNGDNSNQPPSAPQQAGTPTHFPDNEHNSTSDNSTPEGSVAFIPVDMTVPVESSQPSAEDTSSSEPSTSSPTFPVPEDSSLGGGAGESSK